MLHSMTGFARRSAESQQGTLTCEIRAVNHRYLDVQFRLPDVLRQKETELRQKIGATLKRGKVECSLHFRRGLGEADELQLNEALLKQLARRAGELEKLLPETSAVNPLDLLRWPGVVDEPELDAEPVFELAETVLDAALSDLATMRGNEGKRIGTMLESRCADVLALAAGVRERMPEVLAAVRQKQQERLDKLDFDANPERLEVELALIAQKLDVDEELDRLESHVSEIRAALGADEPVGRRLDFLMQELNREANTLGSKSADTHTTRAAVDLKVLIEQMREQIQNLE